MIRRVYTSSCLPIFFCIRVLNKMHTRMPVHLHCQFVQPKVTPTLPETSFLTWARSRECHSLACRDASFQAVGIWLGGTQSPTSIIMPGPRNSKKKGKLQAKKEKRTKVSTRSLDNQPCPLPPQRRPLPPTPSPIATPLHPTTPPHINPEPHSNEYSYVQEPLPPGFYNHQQDVAGFALPKKPFIQDPGNGPRVRDIQAFLASSFAAPPSLEDELCAEFAQEELLQMLCSILPQETAMVGVPHRTLGGVLTSETDTVVQQK